MPDESEVQTGPWDSVDDLPTELLLETVGWTAEMVSRCRRLFDTLRGPSANPGVAQTATLLARLGVPAEVGRRYFYAIRRGPTLSFEDFLVGLVALDPMTGHGGVWNGLRAQFIFRAYDADGDGSLSVSELATLLHHVREAYEHPTLSQERQLAEAAETHLALSSGGALTLGLFREAVGSLRLRGCSRARRPPSDFAARRIVLRAAARSDSWLGASGGVG